MPSYLTHLECTRCGARYNADELQTLCPAGWRRALRPLRPGPRPRRRWTARRSPPARAGMWRYPELMPVRDPTNVVTLGEGCTPLLGRAAAGPAPWRRAAAASKTRGRTRPAASRRAGCRPPSRRRRSWASTRVRDALGGQRGLRAGGVRRRAPGIAPWTSSCPRTRRAPFSQGGARATARTSHLVDGLINDAGAECARPRRRDAAGSTSRRSRSRTACEGKKTMGYELAEQLGWRLPDVIIYPTGGGTGIVGMWKAFDEMEALGWIGSERPRMVVGAGGGLRADRHAPSTAGAERAPTLAGRRTRSRSGMRVPVADRRLPDPARGARERRHGRRRERGRDRRGRPAHQRAGRHLRRAGGRRRRWRRCGQAARAGLRSAPTRPSCSSTRARA